MKQRGRSLYHFQERPPGTVSGCVQSSMNFADFGRGKVLLLHDTVFLSFNRVTGLRSQNTFVLEVENPY